MLLTLGECVKYQGADQTIKMYWLFQIPSSAAYYLIVVSNLASVNRNKVDILPVTG